MKKYRFEMQNCINIEIEADNEIEARSEIIDHIDRYADQMIQDCYISDGAEVTTT